MTTFVLHAMSLALRGISLAGANALDSKAFAMLAGVSIWPVYMTGADLIEALRSQLAQ